MAAAARARRCATAHRVQQRRHAGEQRAEEHPGAQALLREVKDGGVLAHQRLPGGSRRRGAATRLPLLLLRRRRGAALLLRALLLLRLLAVGLGLGSQQTGAQGGRRSGQHPRAAAGR